MHLRIGADLELSRPAARYLCYRRDYRPPVSRRHATTPLAFGCGPIAELLHPPTALKKEQTSALPASATITRQLTLGLYQQGLSIEEIARERNLKPTTILSHLSELIEGGEVLDIERIVQPGRQKVIASALEQIGSDVLKPVKEFLGEDYSYDEIRLVRAVLRRSQ